MATEQAQQQQLQSDLKKVGSDGEDFSDTANETGTFEVTRACVFFSVLDEFSMVNIFVMFNKWSYTVASLTVGKFEWHAAEIFQINCM